MIHVDDDAFVRAPRGLVYRRLTDLGAWGDFWPGCTVTGLGEERFDVRLRAAGPKRTQRLELRAHTWRHDEGFRLHVAGDLRGDAEFWLEEGWGGTVIHHLAALEAANGRDRAAGVHYRAGLRRGFGGLKDVLQSEVRERLGLVP